MRLSPMNLRPRQQKHRRRMRRRWWLFPYRGVALDLRMFRPGMPQGYRPCLLQQYKLGPPLPLEVCVAGTQGQIGYMIQQSLQNKLREMEIDREVVTMVTQVIVDRNDESLKNSEALKKSLEHLDVIKKDLMSIFLKNDIKPIDCLNRKLDPNFHQAMMEIENDEKEPGTIIQEIQKGFTIKDRLLRPSLVAVSKKSDKSKKNAEKNKNTEKNDEN